MKEISKIQIEESVKKAEGEAHEWCAVDWRHTYQIMIDTSDCEIWADTFIDCNSWKKYKSDSIIALDVTAKGGRIGDAIRQLTMAGWKII